MVCAFMRPLACVSVSFESLFRPCSFSFWLFSLSGFVFLCPHLYGLCCVLLFFFFFQGRTTMHVLILFVHVHNAGKQIWDMGCKSIMPVLVITYAPNIENTFWIFLTYIYLFITRCVIQTLALDTMKIIFTLLWLVII